MNPIKIDIPYVCEHDLDVLLLEELVAQPAFLRWFLARINVPRGAGLSRIACAVSTPTGESDLELFVKTAQRTYGVLVEDKLDARLQTQQAQRYERRAAGYIGQRECDECITVIIAPRKYFSNNQDTKGFQYRIDLEDITRKLASAEIGSLRKRHIQALLRTALEKGSSGWRLVPDQSMTEFWRNYWELANRIAPELRMGKPSARPSGSTWIYFKPHDLPGGVQILHKLIPGFMDLQFSGMGDRTAELASRYKGRMGKRMIVERAGKSGVIRIKVPEVDVSVPFERSKPLIQQALREGIRLLKWYRRVSS